jgi:hypothetical protein
MMLIISVQPKPSNFSPSWFPKGFASPLKSYLPLGMICMDQHFFVNIFHINNWGRRDRMVFGFTTCGFLRVLQFLPPMKLTATI